MTTTTTTTARRAPAGSDFAALARRIADEGLMERRPAYYVGRLIAVAVMLVGGWTAFFLIGSSWWQLVTAAFLAVTFTQVALVAHDLAHRQVFRTRRPSEFGGRVAGTLIGMSYGWWVDKHTRHHNNPNHDDLDPDVAPEVLIWAANSAIGRRGFKGFITRHQAALFFPLLTLLALDLKVSSVKALRSNSAMKRRGLEGALLVLHAVGYLAALLIVLSPLQAVAFLLVHQALFGVYLGMTFAPNHKGMPHPDGDEDFLRKQVLTSRNVRGGRLIEVATGGLNYQIEHHLFPGMPSPSLRRAQPIVQAYCAEIGVSYEQTGLIASYRQALEYLHEVGAPAREAHAAR